MHSYPWMTLLLRTGECGRRCSDIRDRVDMQRLAHGYSYRGRHDHPTAMTRRSAYASRRRLLIGILHTSRLIRSTGQILACQPRLRIRNEMSNIQQPSLLLH